MQKLKTFTLRQVLRGILLLAQVALRFPAEGEQRYRRLLLVEQARDTLEVL